MVRLRVKLILSVLCAKLCYCIGRWIADVQIPSDVSLESCEVFLEGESREGFLNLVRGMLLWRPEDRKTAKQLAQDPWINS